MNNEGLQWLANVKPQPRFKDWVKDGELRKLDNDIHRKLHTDAYEEKMKDGPGTNDVGEFITKGLRIEVSGEFASRDPWLGHYVDGAREELRDVKFGVD